MFVKNKFHSLCKQKVISKEKTKPSSDTNPGMYKSYKFDFEAYKALKSHKPKWESYNQKNPADAKYHYHFSNTSKVQAFKSLRSLIQCARENHSRESYKTMKVEDVSCRP